MVALILDVRALLNRLQSDLTVGSAACISKSLQALVMSTPLLCSLTNQDLAPRHCDIDVPLARAQSGAMSAIHVDALLSRCAVCR